MERQRHGSEAVSEGRPYRHRRHTRVRRPLRGLIIAAALCLGASGCATLPAGKHDPRDPFERLNRSVWVFDDALDRALVRPMLREYSDRVPQPVAIGIWNFFSNLTYTDTIANDLLQARIRNGADDIARFVVNTVIGLGGLFDPASRIGLHRHHADFGQTLGIWGFPSGPFLMLPFLGPSDVRDAFGQAGDEYLTLPAYSHDPYVRWGFFSFDQALERYDYMGFNHLIDTAFDPYALVRNAYLQHREFLIHGSRRDLFEEELRLRDADEPIPPRRPAGTHDSSPPPP